MMAPATCESKGSRTITDTYDYDAFGNEVHSTGTTPHNYLYRGEQWDPDLGLYYLRARYYNPTTGRFMSRDPEDGVSHIPASPHKYLYAGGDPINRIDPTGKDSAVEYAWLTTTRAIKTVEYSWSLVGGRPIPPNNQPLTWSPRQFGWKPQGCYVVEFFELAKYLTSAISGIDLDKEACITQGDPDANPFLLCIGNADKNVLARPLI